MYVVNLLPVSIRRGGPFGSAVCVVSNYISVIGLGLWWGPEA